LSTIEVSTGDSGARRALVLHDRQLVVDLIKLTLNHGLFVVQAATSLAEAEAIIAKQRPHLASSTWTTTTAQRCSSGWGPASI